MKIIHLYLYITCNKNILFVKKNILTYCGYLPNSLFFLLLSEHKHCDNAATNSNSENARSRIVASLCGSVGKWTKEDESSSARVCAAGFHHVNGSFWLGALFETYEPFIYSFFQIFFSGLGKRRMTETADSESAETHFIACGCQSPNPGNTPFLMRVLCLVCVISICAVFFRNVTLA